MREPHLFKKHRTEILAHLLIVFCLSSCAALEEASKRRQEKIKQQQSKRYLTLARPDAQISVSTGALEIGSDHYTLTFHEELAQKQSLRRTERARRIRTRRAGVYGEPLYVH